MLDRLASQGRVFTNAHAHNVVTLPSHVNILTGLYPFQHGVRDNSGFRLAGTFPTLATVLRGAGYATGAFVGAFPLDSPPFDWIIVRGIAFRQVLSRSQKTSTENSSPRQSSCTNESTVV